MKQEIYKNKHKLYQFRAELKTNYNLTEEQYYQMIEDQNGGCAICGVPSVVQKNLTKRLSVDHCHDTNMVRGILCQKCNQGLGLFDDSIEKLLTAVRYLERFNSVIGKV